MVVTRTSLGEQSWMESSFFKSCYYPFHSDAQHYRSSPAAITMQLLDSTDPYLAMQSETKGTGDFGITADQQRTIGIVLTVLGGVLSGCLASGLCCLLRVVLAGTENNVTAMDQGASNHATATANCGGQALPAGGFTTITNTHTTTTDFPAPYEEGGGGYYPSNNNYLPAGEGGAQPGAAPAPFPHPLGYTQAEVG